MADAGREPGSGAVFRRRPGGSFEEMATALPRPGGLAASPDGTVYVTDTEHGTILKIKASGEVSPLMIGGLSQPHGLALAPDGALYVADTYNHRVQRLSPTGDVRTLAGGFAYPSGVALDAAGNVYVTDTGHGALQKISPAGIVTALPEVGTGLAGPTAGRR
ncbi:MAG: NHL repeat-containing protein [Hymenobacter sp.]